MFRQIGNRVVLPIFNFVCAITVFLFFTRKNGLSTIFHMPLMFRPNQLGKSS